MEYRCRRLWIRNALYSRFLRHVSLHHLIKQKLSSLRFVKNMDWDGREQPIKQEVKNKWWISTSSSQGGQNITPHVGRQHARKWSPPEFTATRNYRGLGLLAQNVNLITAAHYLPGNPGVSLCPTWHTYNKIRFQEASLPRTALVSSAEAVWKKKNYKPWGGSWGYEITKDTFPPIYFFLSWKPHRQEN